MNDTYESCAQEDEVMRDQIDRIVEYEAKLLQVQGKPLLAAMFLLYFLTSISLLSLIVYWFL